MEQDVRGDCLKYRNSLKLRRAGDGDRTRDVQLGNMAIIRQLNNIACMRVRSGTRECKEFSISSEKVVGMEHKRSIENIVKTYHEERRIRGDHTQLTMQCFRRNDRRHLREQPATEFLRSCSQPPPVIVAKSEASTADLLSQNSVFFHQEFDDVLLMLVHPAGQRREEE
jgi:hypothetical protein